MFNRLLWTILIWLTFVKMYTLMIAQKDWNMSEHQYKGHAVTPIHLYVEWGFICNNEI